MNLFRILFVVATFILFSCNTSDNNSSENQNSNDVSEIRESTTEEDFREVYTDFFTAVKDVNENRFNEYIHPEIGLFIIQQDGAMPNLIYVTDISKFKRSYDNMHFFAFNTDVIGVELIEQELPKINCEVFDGYDKQGCFSQEVNKLAATKFWEFVDTTPELKSKCERAANTIKWTVINTANYGYYFSQINGKWYITFIDMRQPCSA
ncbi:MAG: hypothetical protein ACK4ON_00725 [Bacteroidia bacterium]